MKEDIKGYLISESVTSNIPVIKSDNTNGPTVIETVLQEGDLPNRNGRIYPTSVIKNGINSAYVQERLRRHGWVGESGHPLSEDVKRQLRIEQSNISHIIRKVWFNRNLLMGEVETALTERGKDMQGLIRQGMEVAFSLRGFGKVTEKKGNYLQINDPLNILTYDFVIHPSHEKAYMTKILQESNNPYINKNQNKELSEDGYFIPLTENTINDFLNEESLNVKNMKDQLGFSKNTKPFKKDKNLIYFKEGFDILACYLEDYIDKELDHYLAKF